MAKRTTYGILHIPTGSIVEISKLSRETITTTNEIREYIEGQNNDIYGFYIINIPHLGLIPLRITNKLVLKRFISYLPFRQEMAMDLQGTAQFSEILQGNVPAKSEFEVIILDRTTECQD